ncbi:MAG: lysoplasmalogenase [Marinosulfonomonas sp.]|nr:MAG: lysoplasmalogenase [Marinosulfonomonas sp.]
MFSPAALFALGVVAAVMYLPRTQGRTGWVRSIRKTIPVTLFALAALSEGAPVLLTVALGLSAVGDFALSRPGTKAFLTGMIAFAAAHLAYIALMVAVGENLQLSQWPLVVLMVALGLSTEWWLRPHTGALKWPVRAYVGIILAMGLTALGLPDHRWVALCGALLFVASDLILSIETFVLPDDYKLRKLVGKAVWISYIAAQIGLFWGLGAL